MTPVIVLLQVQQFFASGTTPAHSDRRPWRHNRLHRLLRLLGLDATVQVYGIRIVQFQKEESIGD